MTHAQYLQFKKAHTVITTIIIFAPFLNSMVNSEHNPHISEIAQSKQFTNHWTGVAKTSVNLNKEN